MAIDWAISQVSQKSFSLDSVGTCFAWGGYRYLFWFNGVQPNKSYMDYLYGGWLYPSTWISKDFADTIVVFYDEDFSSPGGGLNEKYYSQLEKLNTYKSHLIATKKFGRTQVLIIDNKSKWLKY